MDLYQQIYPFAFFKGKATTFRKSIKPTWSYMGGPSDQIIEGVPFFSSEPHHIATIRSDDLCVGYDFGFEIPFFFGMRNEGCEITYNRLANLRFKIEKIDPKRSSWGYPYHSYPKLLPLTYLEVDEQKDMSYKEFSTYLVQEIPLMDESTLIFVVPPFPNEGVSLWGPNGDSEGIQIVFSYNPKKGIMSAFSLST